MSEFEKWWKSMAGKIIPMNDSSSFSEVIAKTAWQAAKADSESILQEQQNTIVELEINYNMLFGDFLELQAKNSELSASINDLREALEEIAETNASKHGTTRMMLDRALYITNEALSKTPAQHINDDVLIFTKDSLQEHANEREIAELQAHINVLRENLDYAYYEVNTHFARNIKDLLASTPVQSLQEHDNEVIEKCANVCENNDGSWADYIWNEAVNNCARQIRALKGIV